MAVNITLYPATALFSKPKICSTQPSAKRDEATSSNMQEGEQEGGL
jgi:hypothetical protein